MKLTFKKCLFFCQKFAGVVQRPKIPWAFVGELVVVGAIFLAFQIGKSQFDRCTWQYGVLFAVQVLIMVTSTVASVLVRHKQNTSMDIPHRETTKVGEMTEQLNGSVDNGRIDTESNGGGVSHGCDSEIIINRKVVKSGDGKFQVSNCSTEPANTTTTNGLTNSITSPQEIHVGMHGKESLAAAAAEVSATRAVAMSSNGNLSLNNESGIANHIDLENKSTSSMPAVIADASSWKAHRLIIIWAFVVCVGIIAGMVGLGGGVLIGPLMIELAVHPQSAAATSTLIVLFSSTIATVTFALYGRINLSYFAVYGPVCLVGGIVGTFVLSGLIRKWRMASLVTLMLSGLVVVSAALVAAFGGRQAAVALANGGKFEAADFCTA